jgi:hypothetical protein
MGYDITVNENRIDERMATDRKKLAICVTCFRTSGTKTYFGSNFSICKELFHVLEPLV